MWIVQPPPRHVYGLSPWQHWSPPAGTYEELDIICYSVAKLTGLLLKANPNVVGMLWLPDEVIYDADPLRNEWRANRQAFLGLTLSIQ